MLKVLMLRSKIDRKKKELETLRARSAEFETRSAELAKAIGEVTNDEEQAAVEEQVNALEGERTEHEASVAALEGEIRGLEGELEAEEQKQRETNGAAQPPENTEEKRGRVNFMETRRFKSFTAQERSAFVAREGVKNFLDQTRAMMRSAGSVTGAELTIPEEMLGLMRREVEEKSKLWKYINVRQVKGTSRITIWGETPEAVWTEMCANINELIGNVAQIELDGYKVAGFMTICNAILEDSDEDLAMIIIETLGASIAKATDKAIIWGKGKGYHQPTGIMTRLAQTSQPESWGANRPAWVDLHTTHVLSLNILAKTGAAFFEDLVGALGVARPVYNGEGLFWAMNRKTHMAIKAKALNFNAAGVLLPGMADVMPVIGGEIVEFEDAEMADYEIIGGYGKHYLMVQRAEAKFNRYDEIRALADQTVFVGKEREDGDVVDGEAFVALNFNNGTATAEKDFAPDYANLDMNVLTVVAAAGTATGDTVLTVSGTVAQSDAVLAYKKSASVNKIKVGDKVKGFTELTSGTTQITAAAGTPIAVVELDEADRVISVGTTVSVPKA